MFKVIYFYKVFVYFGYFVSRFEYLNCQLVISNIVQQMENNLQNEGSISKVEQFALLLSKLRFRSPNIGKNLFENRAHTDVGILDLIETVMNLSEDSTQVETLLADAKDELKTMKWSDLELKYKLFLLYLTKMHSFNTAIIPKEAFPIPFEQVEETILASRTFSRQFLIEKLETLPHLIKVARLFGYDIGDQDLTCRLFIPAVSTSSQKIYIVPMYTDDFFINRVEVTWQCKLRFWILQQFLEGSESAVTITPISLPRFGGLLNDKERQDYTKFCLENGGDRELLAILRS